jgi:hypothetical protein
MGGDAPLIFSRVYRKLALFSELSVWRSLGFDIIVNVVECDDWSTVDG